MSEQEDNDITDYLSGLPRAQPAPRVWAGIERMIAAGPKIRYLSSVDWRRAAAAAVLLVTLNTVAILRSQDQPDDTALTAPDEASLVSDYRLYD